MISGGVPADKTVQDGLHSMELKNILTTTTVGDIPVNDAPQMSPSDTVEQAIGVMRQKSHGCVVVCEGGRLIGIFTERDLLKVIAAGDLSASMESVMSTNPKTVVATDSLSIATGHMDRGGYRRLPVVDGQGQPAGILDVKAITHFLVEHFPAAVYNQASHAQLIARHREGA